MAVGAAIGLGLLVGALLVQAATTPHRRPRLPPSPTAAPCADVPTATQPPPAATAAATFTADWPRGQNGFTVQLQALPKDGTTRRR